MIEFKIFLIITLSEELACDLKNYLHVVEIAQFKKESNKFKTNKPSHSEFLIINKNSIKIHGGRFKKPYIAI